ncbi:sulfatase-like hydrolase/transferase [Verrucomicrobiaceae bacterium N1E253]|uniref:Sulfatase-like hydrolase/transferase n=1 Tax=Oceaniferula marina TaxID=2748318 RepID=A0A851GKR9_9BACT|nr:sulfatase [Oceaniferula marina]NWK55320.1 sulfatase-like hydrolase/transferase [Oceaniferula marina]
MNPFHTLTLTSCLLMAMSWLPVTQASDQQTEKPNFVFILADDMAWNGTSFMAHPAIQASKSDYYQTPHLEKLAAEGMRFSHAYAPAPMCTPSRASLITGKSPAQLHMTTPGRGNRAAQPWQKLIQPNHVSEFSEQEQTIAEVLQTRGYVSAHFGKWHLNGGGPGQHGFTVHDGATGNQGPANNEAPNPKDIFGITERATQFMEKQAAAKRPFYLHLAHYAVHSESKALPSSIAEFEKKEKGQYHSDPLFAAMTKDFDTGVGMILDALNKLGIRQHTYVIFMSDNGGSGKGQHRGTPTPLAGGKGSLLEGGIRSPMIIQGPNIKANSFCNANVIGYDLFPTICQLAGLTSTLPEGIEGTSLTPLLFGQADRSSFQRKHQELIFHFPHYGRGPSQSPQSAMILGDFKIIKYYEADATGKSTESGQISIYHLGKDIGEQSDLSTSHPDKARELQQRMQQYLSRIKAQLPQINPDYDPKAEPVRKRPGRRQGNSSPQGPGHRIASMDSNNDGSVSRKEFTGPPRRFDLIDQNNDGMLSEKEWSSAPTGRGRTNAKEDKAPKDEK